MEEEKYFQADNPELKTSDEHSPTTSPISDRHPPPTRHHNHNHNHTPIRDSKYSKKRRFPIKKDFRINLKPDTVEDIKVSLKVHFEAIKSLQDALSRNVNSNNRTNTAKGGMDDGIGDRIQVVQDTLSKVGKSKRAQKEDVRLAVGDIRLAVGNIEEMSIGKLEEQFSDGLKSSQDDKRVYSSSIADAALVGGGATLNAEKGVQEVEMTNSDQLEGQRHVETNSDIISKLLSEVHKLRHDMKAQEKLTKKLIENNQELSKKCELSVSQANLSGEFQGMLKSTVVEEVARGLRGKVDTAVLEELAQHIATKEDFKKCVKKTSFQKYVSKNAILQAEEINNGATVEHEALQKLRRKFEDLSHRVERLEDSVDTSVDSRLHPTDDARDRKLQEWILSHLSLLEEDSKKSLENRFLNVKSEVQDEVKALIFNTVREVVYEFPVDLDCCESSTSPLIRKLIRDFDEKLFTVCSDLSSCKQLFLDQATQPFYRCAQWLWKSGQLKLGSAIPWNIQSCNTDPDNFRWDQDHYNIRIADAGLYEINLAFFTKSKPSIQLVVNGESVLSAINSPSYVVQHSSGFVMDGSGRVEPGTVTGISLVVLND